MNLKHQLPRSAASVPKSAIGESFSTSNPNGIPLVCRFITPEGVSNIMNVIIQEVSMRITYVCFSALGVTTEAQLGGTEAAFLPSWWQKLHGRTSSLYFRAMSGIFTLHKPHLFQISSYLKKNSKLWITSMGLCLNREPSTALRFRATLGLKKKKTRRRTRST